jgi:hypothetical protein
VDERNEHGRGKFDDDDDDDDDNYDNYDIHGDYDD